MFLWQAYSCLWWWSEFQFSFNAGVPQRPVLLFIHLCIYRNANDYTLHPSIQYTSQTQMIQLDLNNNSLLFRQQKVGRFIPNSKMLFKHCCLHHLYPSNQTISFRYYLHIWTKLNVLDAIQKTFKIIFVLIRMNLIFQLWICRKADLLFRENITAEHFMISVLEGLS